MTKSLTDFLEQRSTEQVGRLQQVASVVYTSNDLAYISRFESEYDGFLASVGSNDVAQVASVAPVESNSDDRPVLTKELYKQAVAEGLTSIQVKEQYQLISARQLAGPGRWHGKLGQKPKKDKGPERQKIKEESQAILGWDQYVIERQAGLSHTDIKGKYAQVDAGYLTGLAGMFGRQNKSK
jgi:hypothetical protein